MHALTPARTRQQHHANQPIRALRHAIPAILAVLLSLSLAAPAMAYSVTLPRNTKTDGKTNQVYISDSVWEKVTGYHEVPDWLVGRVIFYGRAADYSSNYSPYYLTVHEYECDDACVPTGRKINVRMVINWNDGKAAHGKLVTMYCHRTNSIKTCPGWLQSADPYLGSPGPQYPNLPAQ